MERLRVDLVEERGIVSIAFPAELFRNEKLEVDDPSDGGEVDDFSAASRAGILDASDDLPDRPHA
jgi:hypothetical protein